jgi:hypothetical protein
MGLWRRRVARESAYLSALAKDSGSRSCFTTGLSDLAHRGDRDFFFILANGDSVNELDDRDFAFVGDHMSVGLNAWPLHPFVPSAYSVELWRRDLDREASEFQFLLTTALGRCGMAPTPILLLRPKSSQVEEVGRLELRNPAQRFLTYGRANVPAVPLKKLDTEIMRSLYFLKARRLENRILLDNGSSVARMASWAVVNGFRRIVLVGVDLNQNQYFWYNQKFISSTGDFRQACRRADGEGEDTLSVVHRPFSTIDYMGSLDRVARSCFGSKVLVGSSNSRLAGTLEVFRF